MKILILGGTKFLGRALVQSAQARGHHLTLFNRGTTNPDLFPEVERLTGDRKLDLSPLDNRQWDVVIDTCGYEPNVVSTSAQKLAGAVERYIFISSISVYANTSQPGTDERAPVAQMPEGAEPVVTPETYGPLKALCEQAVETALPGRALIVRPGLIVGEYDPTDRFTYWPWRVAQGGDVLAPNGPGYLTQFIDVRDLADWIIRMAEAGKTGIYNATGPEQPLPLGKLMETSRTVSGSDARFVWAPEAFLLENGVQPWSQLPLWIPENDPDIGSNQTSIRKALQDGLTFRTLEDTVRSTLDWANSSPAGHEWRAGLPREREQELLRKFSASSSAREG